MEEKLKESIHLVGGLEEMKRQQKEEIIKEINYRSKFPKQK